MQNLPATLLYLATIITLLNAHQLQAATPFGGPLADLHAISQDFDELDHDLRFTDDFNSMEIRNMVLIGAGAIVGTVLLGTLTFYFTRDCIVWPTKKLYRRLLQTSCCRRLQNYLEPQNTHEQRRLLLVNDQEADYELP